MCARARVNNRESAGLTLGKRRVVVAYSTNYSGVIKTGRPAEENFGAAGSAVMKFGCSELEKQTEYKNDKCILFSIYVVFKILIS